MQLKNQIHLGYCTNIHRGETWDETFAGLATHTDAVRQRVAPDEPYGLGLRLSAEAAGTLAESGSKDKFRRWLGETGSYLYTVNGFPFGKFHGGRVKEQVYAPDWSTRERLDYTILLFELLDDLAPPGSEISVSTLPGSYKAFIHPETEADQWEAIISNLRQCSLAIDRLRDVSGRDIHLGLEPEPLGLFEDSKESVSFFERLVDGLSESETERLLQNIGINYDTCHLAIEYEEPGAAISRLRDNDIRISKIHLSSALKVIPEAALMPRLEAFQDEVYLHQVLVRRGGRVAERFEDLPDALAWAGSVGTDDLGDEWRIHFHVPIHAEPAPGFDTTRDHLVGTLDLVGSDPELCRHFEMETYTWEVLPESMRSGDVVDQLVAEYGWCLDQFARVGLR